MASPLSTGYHTFPFASGHTVTPEWPGSHSRGTQCAEDTHISDRSCTASSFVLLRVWAYPSVLLAGVSALSVRTVLCNLGTFLDINTAPCIRPSPETLPSSLGGKCPVPSSIAGGGSPMGQRCGQPLLLLTAGSSVGFFPNQWSFLRKLPG